MTSRAAHVFQIVVLARNAQTLLRRRGAREISFFLSCENIFKWHHARVGKVERGVVDGDETRAFDGGVIFGNEVGEKFFTKDVAGH